MLFIGWKYSALNGWQEAAIRGAWANRTAFSFAQPTNKMPRTPGGRDITPQILLPIGLFFAGLSEKGRLPRGSKKLVMQTFKVSLRTRIVLE